jgi:hypothetical protein
VIWGHFRVSYINIESSTILMTLIDKNFLKLSKICPLCLSRYEHLHCFVQVHFKISMNMHQSLTDDLVATIYEAYQADIYLSLEDFRREVARWLTYWVITKRNDLPTTLYHTWFCKSSSLSFYRYNINKTMCFVYHVSSKRYCWKVIANHYV